MTEIPWTKHVINDISWIPETYFELDDKETNGATIYEQLKYVEKEVVRNNDIKTLKQLLKELIENKYLNESSKVNIENEFLELVSKYKWNDNDSNLNYMLAIYYWVYKRDTINAWKYVENIYKNNDSDDLKRDIKRLLDKNINSDKYDENALYHFVIFYKSFTDVINELLSKSSDIEKERYISLKQVVEKMNYKLKIYELMYFLKLILWIK